MSSLIFYTDENQIYVATDTLATESNGVPFLLTSKALHIPHLNIIVAGTGQGGFLSNFILHLNSYMVVNNINQLNYHTPELLSRLWSQHKEQFGTSEQSTSTIYIFGFCELTGRVISFAYRSVSEFISEELPYAIGVKPECPLPENVSLNENIPEIMLKQIEIQKKESNPVYIGGSIQELHMTKEQCPSRSIYEFEDLASAAKQIFL